MRINWNILDWNIRGIKSLDIWNDISLRSEESNCNIIFLWETKKEFFDQSYIRNFCNRKFDQFSYIPSIGNSWRIITIWNGSLFNGSISSQNEYQITIEFTCKISGTNWFLTNVYGPSYNEDRHDFFTWLADLDSTQMKLWMLVGDFNLIREPENRSRPGGDNNNMLYFNTVIQAHDLEEIPLKGRSYTWSNMQ
jgi:hypothetical protein